MTFQILQWFDATPERIAALSNDDLRASAEWARHCYDVLTYGSDFLGEEEIKRSGRMLDAAAQIFAVERQDRRKVERCVGHAACSLFSRLVSSASMCAAASSIRPERLISSSPRKSLP
jgi:hypothetical protein